MCQLRQRWENLNKDQSTKLQLSLNSLEQDQLSPVRPLSTILTFSYGRSCCHMGFCFSRVFFSNYTCVQVLLWSRLSSPSLVFKGEIVGETSLSPRSLFEACSQTLQRITQEVKYGCFYPEEQIYSLISSPE